MTDSPQPQPKKQPAWLLYVALLLSGIILLAEAAGLTAINRWTVKLGVALVFSAGALFIGNGRMSGFVAVGILWLAVLGTFLV